MALNELVRTPIRKGSGVLVLELEEVMSDDREYGTLKRNGGEEVEGHVCGCKSRSGALVGAGGRRRKWDLV